MKHSSFYFNVAELTAELSYCNRRKVGAVLVSSDGSTILSHGYNGTISGFPNVCELPDGTTDNNSVLHAETNAIMKAAKMGSGTNGTMLFITLSPCVNCAKLIIQAGIKKVYYKEDYADLTGVEILKKAGIEIYKSK